MILTDGCRVFRMGSRYDVRQTREKEMKIEEREKHFATLFVARVAALSSMENSPEINNRYQWQIHESGRRFAENALEYLEKIELTETKK